MLAKLEKATIELVALIRQFMNLTEKLEVKIYGSEVKPASTNKKIQNNGQKGCQK